MDFSDLEAKVQSHTGIAKQTNTEVVQQTKTNNSNIVIDTPTAIVGAIVLILGLSLIHI